MKPTCDHCNRILQWGEIMICAIKNGGIIWAECMPCCEGKPEAKKSKQTEGITWAHYKFGEELFKSSL